MREGYAAKSQRLFASLAATRDDHSHSSSRTRVSPDGRQGQQLRPSLLYHTSTLKHVPLRFPIAFPNRICVHFDIAVAVNVGSFSHGAIETGL